jgi:transposase
MITEHQYRRLMNEIQNCGVIDHAAMKAGMHRQTARRYLKAQAGPTAISKPHTWRTRDDPLCDIWPEAERWLAESPEIEAKALFEHLLIKYPGQLDGKALRTFQRRVTEWLRRHGPPKEVFFAQVHEPGECIQTDWTRCFELEVTIGGEAYPHLLCHCVLPYSNWEWAIPCLSESALSLKTGLQASLWELGGVPRYSQTDQSSTATHQLRRGDLRRGFNSEYLALCAHLGLQARTITVGNPNQNGDIEAAQGVIKRRLTNQLILRRSRDFDSIEDYAKFVSSVCRGANALRVSRFEEERSVLQPLPATAFPSEEITTVRVSSYSTVRVRGSAYSVPSRLIGSFIQAHICEQSVRFLFLGDAVATYPRSARGVPQIDYRHIISSLASKPGAFSRYLYREELFPRTAFRQAYDRLLLIEERTASARYLALLKLASEHGEDRVADLLGILLRQGEPPLGDVIELQLASPLKSEAILLSVLIPELQTYDALIEEVAS